MATNQNIQTTQLDFDGIKENLKDYLRGQTEFTDYDFEGSGLSILLDVLAYNTHYNALYTNLAVNESFLDSASKRNSVVSKANELGYMPRSAIAATAVLNLTVFNSAGPDQIEIPRLSTFTSQVDGVSYIFYLLESQIATKVGSQYNFRNLNVVEGSYLEFKYIVGQQNRFLIPNQNVDTTTLKVTVQQTAQSTTSDTFLPATDILNLTSTSKAYFIKEIADGLYEVEFGNGVVGAALVPGNVVTLSYLVCNGPSANGAKTFTYTGPTLGTSVALSTVSSARGGALPESVDSIKWSAPRSYTTQNRCVTTEDYKSIITSMFPEAKSVNVWGGETTSPPQYGKVFISVIPRTSDILTTEDKDYILNTIVNPRKSLTVTPVIVDPTYIKLEVNTTVYYNPQLTTRGLNDITSLVRATITNYNDNNLSSFEGVFKHSRLSALIDNTEKSIVSNVTTIKLHRSVAPSYLITSQYIIDLGNPIYQDIVTYNSVVSTGFITPESGFVCYIDNDPQTNQGTIGNLRLFYINNLGEKVVIRNVGTVNFATGRLTINDLNITRLNTPTWDFTIVPQSNDVASTLNQFVIIDPLRTTVTAVVDTPSSTYRFTSSRQ